MMADVYENASCFMRKTMTDRLTSAQRHLVMSHIHSKGTKPELKVRQWLWARVERDTLYRILTGTQLRFIVIQFLFVFLHCKKSRTRRLFFQCND